MNYEFLRCHIENKVAVVTISHSPGNKLNTQVYQEITQLKGELEANENINVIVITGEGEASFVVGAEFSEMADLDTVDMLDLTQITINCFVKIENLNNAMIAIINNKTR